MKTSQKVYLAIMHEPEHIKCEPLSLPEEDEPHAQECADDGALEDTVVVKCETVWLPENEGAVPSEEAEEKVAADDVNKNVKWQYVLQLKLNFWRRWAKEYPNTLQRHRSYPNRCLGAVVLIKDKNLPPLRWKYGVIEAVHPERRSSTCINSPT
ncbi:uncharacterized protein [Anabrus simplex]|uniref:uncharacterized protein n=1 Tax=Anabrus simplex TaxID=316456 RepID=UPI0035A3988F